jgi:mannosyltransferase
MISAAAQDSAPRARSEAARWFWPAVSVLTVAGFALRAWHMSAQNLWTDEVETAKIALLSAADLMRAVHGELPILPTVWLSPLYFLLLRTVLLLPHASVDSALRLSSVVVGAVTIPALAWTGRRLLGAPAALAATVVLALSPFHVWYSQEVRPYALLVLLTVLTIGLFARALQRPTAGAWSAFGSAAVLALYTHPIAVTLPLICGLALLVAARTHSRLPRGGLLTLAAIGVAYLPAVAAIRARGANVIADARGVSVVDVPYAVYTYVVGFSLGPSTRTSAGNATME